VVAVGGCRGARDPVLSVEPRRGRDSEHCHAVDRQAFWPLARPRGGTKARGTTALSSNGASVCLWMTTTMVTRARNQRVMVPEHLPLRRRPSSGGEASVRAAQGRRRMGESPERREAPQARNTAQQRP